MSIGRLYSMFVWFIFLVAVLTGCGPKGGGGEGGICGNGVKEVGEVCDGDDLGGETCESQGFGGGMLYCLDNCEGFSTGHCISAQCGNGEKNLDEECDGDDLGGATCADYGFTDGSLFCDPYCKIDYSECYACGNDIKEGPEDCDGPQLGGMSCENVGYTGGVLSCNADCTYDESGCFLCGDDICETEKGENGTLCPEDCGWLKLSAGSYHTCGVTKEGVPYCWGDNSSGQLGSGTDTNSATPVKVAVLDEVVDIAAGGYHTCAYTSAGQAWCWGANYTGALGDGTQTLSNVPVQVVSGAGVTSISTGQEHTCAVKSGQVWCWGYNAFGQLGNDDTVDSWTMVRAGDLSGIESVSCGGNHTCAVSGSGSAWCWGRNVSGQVGDGTDGNARHQPVQLSGLTNVAAVSAGRFDHTCAVMSWFAIFCWGSNEFGQLGTGDQESKNEPTQVGTDYEMIQAGRDHTCALDTAGAAWCWGSNDNGRLGDGSGSNQAYPSAVAGLQAAVSSIAVGGQHSCAVRTDGTAWCWGLNDKGQLGDGSNNDSELTVEVVLGQ